MADNEEVLETEESEEEAFARAMREEEEDWESEEEAFARAMREEEEDWESEEESEEEAFARAMREEAEEEDDSEESEEEAFARAMREEDESEEEDLDIFGSEDDSEEEFETAIDIFDPQMGETSSEEDTDYVQDPEDLKELGFSRSTKAENESLSEEIASGSISADLRIDKSSYSIEPGTVLVDDLVIPEPIKKHRKRTYSGLTKSVSEMGVIEPIHVLMLEGYQEWLNEDHDSWEIYPGSKYQLLSGMRRLFAAVKNGLVEVPAQIWKFKDPEYGREVSILLTMLLDKKVKHSWEEVWNTFRVLEDLYENLSPSKIEYLLDIEPGAAMKLKDIMESQEDFPEVVEDLLEDKKTLQQAYNALQKLRKELNQWEIEDSRGLGEVEEAAEVVGDESDGEIRSADDVKRILEIGDEDIDLDEDSFGGALGEFEAEQQRVDDRHPLDPVLRGKVLNRDEYSCQICMMGEGMNSSLILPSLTVHHRIPVYINEKNHPSVRCEDSAENLITLCATCHNTVHAVSDAGLKLGISKEDFDEMEKYQQDRWTNILKNARIISEAEKAVGYKRNKLKPRTLPPSKPFWVLDKENSEAIKLAETADVER